MASVLLNLENLQPVERRMKEFIIRICTKICKYPMTLIIATASITITKSSRASWGIV